MPPKKVKSKDEHDSDSDGLNEIANLNIDDDNKLSEIVVGVEEDIFDIEDVKENNSLFRGPYKGIGIKIDPIISGKRSRSHPSPIIASPFSPLSSGNNTPISIGSIGSYNTESSNKAIAFEKSKKQKKDHNEAKNKNLNMQRSQFCQECVPGSVLFHPGRPPKSSKKKKKGGKTKKRKNNRKKTRRKYKR